MTGKEKKLLEQLLVASEYLRQLLGEEKNWAFTVDGKTVTAASLRHDIEEAVKPYFDAAVAAAEHPEAADAPGHFTKQQEEFIITFLRLVAANAKRKPHLGFMLEGMAYAGLENLTGVDQDTIKEDILEEERKRDEAMGTDTTEVKCYGPRIFLREPTAKEVEKYGAENIRVIRNGKIEEYNG